MIWLTVALASVTSATHVGQVDGDQITWTSTFHGPGQLCVPVRPDDTSNGSVQAGLACGVAPLEVTRTQPAGDLHPPMGTPGLHRVMLKGAAYEPVGLVRTAGGYTALDVSRADRLGFDAKLGKHGPRKLRPAIYLRGPVDAPIPGELVSEGPAPWKRWGILAGLLGVIVLGLLGHRALGRVARAERIARWGTDRTVLDELERDGIV